MTDECSCVDCMIERGEITEEESSDLIFGCAYCGTMGFEDYPLNEIPCRLGHDPRPVPGITEPGYVMNYPEPEEGKPREGHWLWTGNGWSNISLWLRNQGFEIVPIND